MKNNDIEESGVTKRDSGVTKCSNTGSWIQACDQLTEANAGRIGDIGMQTLRNMETNEFRLAVVAGRYAKNRVQLKYCPFCGENITTDYKTKGATS